MDIYHANVIKGPIAVLIQNCREIIEESFPFVCSAAIWGIA